MQGWLWIRSPRTALPRQPWSIDSGNARTALLPLDKKWRWRQSALVAIMDKQYLTCHHHHGRARIRPPHAERILSGFFNINFWRSLRTWRSGKGRHDPTTTTSGQSNQSIFCKSVGVPSNYRKNQHQLNDDQRYSQKKNDGQHRTQSWSQ